MTMSNPLFLLLLLLVHITEQVVYDFTKNLVKHDDHHSSHHHGARRNKNGRTTNASIEGVNIDSVLNNLDNQEPFDNIYTLDKLKNEKTKKGKDLNLLINNSKQNISLDHRASEFAEIQLDDEKDRSSETDTQTIQNAKTKNSKDYNLIINNSKENISLDHTAADEFPGVQSNVENAPDTHRPSEFESRTMLVPGFNPEKEQYGMTDSTWMTYENDVSLPVTLKASGDVVPMAKDHPKEKATGCRLAKGSRLLFCQ